MSSTTAVNLPAGTWNVDVAHSEASFTVRHMMLSKVRGRFTGFSATITVPENPLEASVEATIDAASINTNDANRDAHLRNNDFFDVENFPTWTYRSTGVRADGGDFVLTGELTIKGVTRPVELELEFAGTEKDPWGGTRAGFNAKGEISRKDFGLEYNALLESGGVVIADKVKIELDIQAVKA